MKYTNVTCSNLCFVFFLGLHHRATKIHIGSSIHEAQKRRVKKLDILCVVSGNFFHPKGAVGVKKMVDETRIKDPAEEKSEQTHKCIANEVMVARVIQKVNRRLER